MAMRRMRRNWDPGVGESGFGFEGQAWPGVEIILQDQGRCDGVELRLSFPPVLFPPRQQLFGLMAREPFVLQDDRHGRVPSEPRCQLLDRGGLLVRLAGEAARQPDGDASCFAY